MKATINRLTYDTTAAIEIASDSFGYSSDFHHWSETLYKTKNGNYFLHGVGGALSKYSTSLGNNSYGGGSAIVPMTESETITWCEEHECQSAIETHFAHAVQEA